MGTLASPREAPRRRRSPNLLDELAQRTREMDPQGVGVTADTIRKLPERRHTEYRIADAVVTAAGRPMAFYDGTIGVLTDGQVSSGVVPNPRAPVTERARCCGGCDTLNGSATAQA